MSRPRFRPAVESLETRDVPATFTVMTAADAGAGSLRAAITSANTTPGLDTIAFNIPGSGVQTINLLSALPSVTDSAIVDGYTQPGSSPNTLAVGNDAVLLVELNGAGAGQASGLTLTGATSSTVRGLVINRFQGGGSFTGGSGIYAPQGNGHTITGNVIGLDPTGTTARGNAAAGVEIQNGVSDVVVGGSAAADRNVISGNGRSAVQAFGGAQRTRVEGNYLGTDATGTLDRGNNWYGVLFSGGGAATVAGNVISGNTLHGVMIQDTSTGNTVQNNVIGLNAAGTADLGNTQSGVRIQASSNNAITGNVISGNDQRGVEIEAASTGNVIRGNTMGLDVSGTIDLGNTGDGVYLLNASGNTIGGATAADRNVISGNNGNGIFFLVTQTGSTATNTIQGNYVGTDRTGTLDRGNSLKGMNLASSLNSTVRGNLVSGNDTGGIVIGSTGGGGVGASGNVVAGNVVGLDATGTALLGNTGAGVFVVGANRVGGIVAADRNVISGNTGHGVHVATTGGPEGTQIQGNFIGTDAAGVVDLGNTGHGVYIERAKNNTVGGTAAGAGNLISGNDSDGVALADGSGAAGNNVVQGNRIGVNAAGTAKLGNGRHGVLIDGQASNTVGGTAAGSGNLIGGNGQAGVLIGATHFTTANTVQGNAIGTDAAGAMNLGNGGTGVWVYNANGNTVGGVGGGNTIAFNAGAGVLVETTSTILGQLSAANNRVSRNAIYSNGGLGIDLSPTSGVTANDPGDGDTGANFRQNFPLLAPGVSDYVTTTLTGTLNSKANTAYTLEFFASATADATGFGEGQRFLGSATVTTDAAGNAAFNVTLPGGVGAGERVTATATDPAGNTSEFSAAVVVNHPPTASAGGPYAVPENGAVELDATATSDPEQSAASLAYAWDLDGDGVFGETGAAAGRGNEVGVRPTFSALGLDGTGAAPLTVSLRVTDAGGLVGTATAAVSVANVAPTISSVVSSGPVEAGTSVTVSVTASDPAGALDPLLYEFDFDGDGAFEVGPQAGATAAHTFDVAGNCTVNVRVTDGDGGQALGSVLVTVTNAVPVANGQSVTAVEDTPAAAVLSATDHENDALTFEVVTGPAHGTLSGTGPNLTYRPDANYNGSDAFTFRVFDGHNYSNAASVSLAVTAVNDPPVADAGPDATGVQLRDVTFHGTATDVEGQSLSYAWDFGDGTTAAEADAIHVYAEPGTYTATLTVTDAGGAAGTDTLTMSVRALNPTANADTATTNEDATATIVVLTNDTNPAGPADPLVITAVTQGSFGAVAVDADGTLTYTPAADAHGTDTFTYTVRNADGGTATGTVTITVDPMNDAPAAAAGTYSTNEDAALTVAAPGVLTNATDVDGDTLTAVLVSGPSHGTLTLNSNGSFTYTPAADFNGSDSFTFKANDGAADSNAVTISITVNPVNDAPVAGADSATTDEDTAVTVALLGNDSDADGDALSVTGVTQGGHGRVVNNGDGTVTYTPDADFNGSDSFTYTVSDGAGGTATAAVGITVAPVNDAPVAANQSVTTNEDAPRSGTLAAADLDSASLTYSIVTGPAHGTVTVTNPTTGAYTYTPAANYNGPDSFTFKANDGTVDSNAATVAVTVAAVNDAPAAVADSYAVNEDATLTVAAPGVLVNDSDVDGDALSVTVASGPTHGTLALNANGSFTYTPAANYHGADAFTYAVSDGHGGTATGVVGITVPSVNDAPGAANNSYTATGGTALSVAAPGVLQNDTDADGDALTAVLVSGPAHGTLALNANGSFTYTPAAGFSGTDTFTYRASDGTTASDPATVSISVTGGGAGASLVPDPCDPTKTALVVRGTAGNDTITITPSGHSGAVTVKLNGTSLGTFNPTGRVIVYGLAGDDDIQVAGAVSRPVWLHGGAGNDRLKGGDGDDVLLGEDGDDLLVGGGGRDLLIGGEGEDRIVGNDEDDILVAGFTDFDANDHALCAIMDEWTSSHSYAVRVLNLWSGTPCVGRENGNVFLNSTTVHDEGLEDVLTGSAGNDWFLYNADGDGARRDRVTDRSVFEWLFAADIDFIYVDPT